MCFCTRIQSKHKYFYSIYLSALGLSRSLQALSYSRWNLAPLPGINAPPLHPTLGTWSLSHWTSREVPKTFLKLDNCIRRGKDRTHDCSVEMDILETSLEIQWLRIQASTAGDMGLIPGWGTKIPHVE